MWKPAGSGFRDYQHYFDFGPCSRNGVGIQKGAQVFGPQLLGFDVQQGGLGPMFLNCKMVDAGLGLWHSGEGYEDIRQKLTCKERHRGITGILQLGI